MTGRDAFSIVRRTPERITPSSGLVVLSSIGGYDRPSWDESHSPMDDIN